MQLQRRFRCGDELHLRGQFNAGLRRRRELRVLHVSFTLRLDQNVSWSFEAAGKASDWLETFAEAMGLSEDAGKSRRHLLFEELPSQPGIPLGPVLGKSLIRLPAGKWRFRELGGLSFFEHPAVKKVFCGLEAGLEWPFRVEQMRRSLLPVFADAVLAGGLPIHGALVEHKGSGIILAGRSGEGKSTACGRLPVPWRTVSDDMCLVLKSPEGGFRARPLPTWSVFRHDRAAGRVRAGAMLPLRAVFFLKQAPEDECLEMKRSAAAISLASVALQVFRSIDSEFPRAEDSDVKRGLVANAASLALAIPSYILRIGLTGCFWEKMEKVLEKGDSPHFQHETRGWKTA
jgi:SynChlorMet cassette protein ScmC